MILVGKLKFNSQNELKIYTKKLIDKIGLYENIKEDFENEFDFLIELCKRHPKYQEKFSNFINLSIRHDILNKNSKRLIIIKNNNIEDTISIATCIKGKTEDNTTSFKKALRTSIKNQILEFKTNNNDLFCEICGKDDINFHTDHLNYFEKLVQEFIKLYNIDIPQKYSKIPNTNETIFEKKDSYISALFEKYHKDNAILRNLCKRCNLTRTKFKNNSHSISKLRYLSS